jgi:hypothetical protein
VNKKAQAGLEYLMTYGWALILIATVVGVLVFIVSSPAENVIFTVSDPTKFTLKGQALTGPSLEAKLQNITGGPITLTEVTIPADYGSCEINGNPLSGGPNTTAINVGSGGEIFVDCPNITNATGWLDFEYRDATGLLRNASLKASSSGTSGSGSCIDGATQACSNQTGVCAGSQETCTSGSWPGCGAAQYGASYQATESSCSDGLDNDCDGLTDCADTSCDAACTVYFEKQDFDTDQDCITPNVCITRDDFQGIYNSSQEGWFSWGYSPADTRWRYGACGSNPAGLSWNYEWTDVKPWPTTDLVGRTYCVKLVSDNQYYEITFDSWTSGMPPGGGFS